MALRLWRYEMEFPVAVYFYPASDGRYSELLLDALLLCGFPRILFGS